MKNKKILSTVIVLMMLLSMLPRLAITKIYAAGGPVIDVSTGEDVDTGLASGAGWNFAGTVITITASGDYTLTGTTGTNRVVIDDGVTATVTLDDVTFNSPAGGAPISLAGNADLTLTLAGTNTLTAVAGQSGITVASTQQLTIDGDGILNLTGGNGIYVTGGAVNIIDGTVAASGSNGIFVSAGALNISGGAVTVTASSGYGLYVNGGTAIATISGGQVTATANSRTGIFVGAGGVLFINDGAVTATANNGGLAVSAGTVTINGGTVTVTGISGTGISAPSSTVTITGGDVKASGTTGIFASSGTVAITGGTIVANGTINDLSGTFTITGGSVNAVNETVVGTITNGTDPVFMYVIDTGVPNDPVISTNIPGYGLKDVYTDASSKVYLWAPDTIIEVTAGTEPYVSDSMIDVGTGLGVPHGFDHGTGWNYNAAAHIITITGDGDYTLTGTTAVNRVIIDNGVTATVTLDNVTFNQPAGGSPLTLTGNADLTLMLSGDNSLRGEGVAGKYGINLGSTQSLTIDGEGSLTLTGNAGIYNAGATVNIIGGTITAEGTNMGIYAFNGVVNISGGCVATTGGNNGMDITGSTVNISGGHVTATGTASSGFYTTMGGTYNISGGDVTATGSANGFYAMMITGTFNISGGTTVINGATCDIRMSGTITGGSVHTVNGTITGTVTNGTDPVYMSIIDTGEANAAVTKTNIPGYGLKDVYTDASSKVYLWAPDTIIEVTAGTEPYVSDSVIDVGTGLGVPHGFDHGTGWNYNAAAHIITITGDGEYTLTGSTTENRVVIIDGVTAIVTLDNATINQPSGGNPISLEGNANLTLTLTGVNNLTDADDHGIFVDDSQVLTINGTGKLNVTATAPTYGYGIFVTNGIINIESGTVVAQGSNSGILEINTKTTVINISGGNLTAIGEVYGISAMSCIMNISGGNITATGGNYGISFIINAAVNITGGTITASGDVFDLYNFVNGIFHITGGSLHALNERISAVTTNGTNPVSMNIIDLGVPNFLVGSTDIPGYGLKDVHTDEEGKVYLWGPTSAELFVDEDYGLLFDASTGKMYLDVAGDGTVASNTAYEYTSGSGITWTGTPGSLTLDGFEWITPAMAALRIVNGDVTIDLSGVNTLTSTAAGATSYGGIRADANLTFTGTGILNATGGNASSSYGIYAGGKITVNDGTVIATSGNGTTSYAMCGSGGVTVNGGMVSASAGTAMLSFGMLKLTGVFEITGGTLEAAGYTSALSTAPNTLPSVYNWTSSTVFDGSSPTTGSFPGTPYTHSSSNKYIKIQVPNTAYGLIFDTSTGKMYLDKAGDGTVASNTAYEYTAGSGTTWTGTPGNLVLSGFEWDTPARVALTITGGDATIDLEGTSENAFKTSYTATGIYDWPSAIYSENAVSITGTGTLNASSADASNCNLVYGINVAKFSVEGGTINAAGGNASGYSWGINARSNSMAVSGGTINAIGGEAFVSAGIESYYSLTVSGGTINATASDSADYGFGINTYALIFDGGNIVAMGNASAIAYGVNPMDVYITAPAYVYWINTITDAPGGAGTTVPGGTAYSHSTSSQYVKLEALDIYTVTYNLDGGTQQAGTWGSYIYSIGLTLPTAPTKTNYTFAGWYDNSGLIGSPVTAISTSTTGNKEFWAKWTPDSYIVTYNLDGGTQEAGTWDSYTYGVGLTLPTVPTKANYTFAGWYDNSALTGSPVTDISATATGAKEYWAKWTSSYKDILTVSIPGQVGAAVISGTDISVTMPCGTDVTDLTPTIAISAGASISPASGTSQDFTDPVIYTVTAEDMTTKTYVVTISIADPTQYSVIYHFGVWSGGGNSAGGIDGPFDKFVRLIYDDQVVDPDNYTVTEGSTVITLTESYLNTFANGTHIFRAEFTDGYADLTLTISKQSNGNGHPNTGDNSNMWRWVLLGSVSLLGAIFMLIRRKHLYYLLSAKP